MSRICQSRKNMHSVMNNGGKAGLLRITRNGKSISIPKSWLFNDGRLKKYAIKEVNMMFMAMERKHAKAV